MSVDTRGFKQYQKSLEEAISGLPTIFKKTTRDICEELRDNVKEKTPIYIDKYPEYKGYWHGDLHSANAGKLREAWDKDNPYFKVKKAGNEYSSIVRNLNYYASYVENGHSQTVGKAFPVFKDGKVVYIRKKRSFVEGQHFLQRAEDEVQAKMDLLIQKNITDYLERKIK